MPSSISALLIASLSPASTQSPTWRLIHGSFPTNVKGQKLQDFPHLKRWFESIKARAAVVRAYDKAKEINTQPTVTEESKRILFGQTAAAVGR